MTIILGFITLFSCIALLIGLIKPSFIMFWSKRPTRLKMLGFWLLSIVVISLLGSLSISDEEKAQSSINAAKIKITKKKYEVVSSDLKDIDKKNPLYDEAQRLIYKADSLVALQAREEKIKQEKEFKEKLEREIASIEKGIDFSTYRGSVASIQIEIALFSIWAKYIEEGFAYQDDEIQELSKKLKVKVQKIQTKEFPLLRKNYKEVVRDILWTENIKTSIYARGYRTIQFTGGIFANNKNKMEMQNNLSEILTLLRFKRANYKWYKYDDDYTYYTLNTPSDKEIINID